ncbi:hypothetical protein CPSG_07698 [Coccidioides posadasii str. Silveira]|uniref:Uncharacterized protein n=1 Tax=Coccidioides posadasii (strain RMSCC 757 / Silveira) TaxID=443226 RepID=E9DDQ6_COCPS|nr:hypothetical protein CPSG_07698 [Coccidioides posadasii str. Silveira]
MSHLTAENAKAISIFRLCLQSKGERGVISLIPVGQEPRCAVLHASYRPKLILGTANFRFITDIFCPSNPVQEKVPLRFDAGNRREKDRISR